MDNENVIDNNIDPNTLNFLLEPSSIGEALEDYFKKLEVISPDRNIVAMHIPLGVNEEGQVPIIATLQPLEASRAN